MSNNDAYTTIRIVPINKFYDDLLLIRLLIKSKLIYLLLKSYARRTFETIITMVRKYNNLFIYVYPFSWVYIYPYIIAYLNYWFRYQ